MKKSKVNFLEIIKKNIKVVLFVIQLKCMIIFIIRIIDVKSVKLHDKERRYYKNEQLIEIYENKIYKQKN